MGSIQITFPTYLVTHANRIYKYKKQKESYVQIRLKRSKI